MSSSHSVQVGAWIGLEVADPTPSPPRSRTRPSSPSVDAHYGPTSREAEVLELVAAGMTNRQIAATLYISAKTASVHVANIAQARRHQPKAGRGRFDGCPVPARTLVPSLRHTDPRQRRSDGTNERSAAARRGQDVSMVRSPFGLAHSPV
ncbi:MAG: helix-turn-helix domain-containing protein [Acidimicrobiales bacterium]